MCHGGIYSVPALSSCSVPLYSFFPRHASAFALSGIKFTDFSFVFPFSAPQKSFFLPFPSGFRLLFRPSGIFRLPVPFRLVCADCTILSSVCLFLPLLSPSVPLHSLPGKIFRSSPPCPDLLRSFLYLRPRPRVVLLLFPRRLLRSADESEDKSSERFFAALPSFSPAWREVGCLLTKQCAARKGDAPWHHDFPIPFLSVISPGLYRSGPFQKRKRKQPADYKSSGKNSDKDQQFQTDIPGFFHHHEIDHAEHRADRADVYSR